MIDEVQAKLGSIDKVWHCTEDSSLGKRLNKNRTVLRHIVFGDNNITNTVPMCTATSDHNKSNNCDSHY